MADVSEQDKRRDKAARKQRRRLKERAALANDDDAAAGNNQREAASSEQGLSQLQIMELPQFDVEDEAFDADQFPLPARSRVDVEHGVADGCRVREYVEHEISGAFFRVRQRSESSDGDARWLSRGLQSRRQPLDAQKETTGDGDVHSGTLVATSSWCIGLLWQDLDSALVAMCHGITTGLSWMDAFSLSTSHSILDPAAKTTLCHLEGRRLENLPVEAIKALIQMHQVALERSQTMLVTKLKSQNPTLFQT
ncbi:hypothetical protein ATCC90586_008329 [Pythium insidiosum]|nr:hypothetical protein ATCC90586_008329 [Pythium insidiosum]